MNRITMARQLFAGAAVTVAVALGASTSNVAVAEEPCAVTDVDFATVGSLLVRDTQFGAGNGVYPLGTGRVRLRFENGPDGLPTEAKLMSYELDNHFTIQASFAFWWTKVVTESRTTTASLCEGAARGALHHGDIVWTTKVEGYHSDGTMQCEGNVCGKFGAPPPGSSPLHEAAAVAFHPFRFSPDGKTFTMEYAEVSHSDSPQQTSYVSLSGRETKRVCVMHAVTCS